MCSPGPSSVQGCGSLLLQISLGRKSTCGIEEAGSRASGGHYGKRSTDLAISMRRHFVHGIGGLTKAGAGHPEHHPDRHLLRVRANSAETPLEGMETSRRARAAVSSSRATPAHRADASRCKTLLRRPVHVPFRVRRTKHFAESSRVPCGGFHGFSGGGSRPHCSRTFLRRYLFAVNPSSSA
jgi:hypothetical protein